MKYLLLLIAVFGVNECIAVGTSAESVNAFNKYMSPTDGIDMYSGHAALRYPLLKLRGRRGLDAELVMSYSSNVYTNVRARNDIAPTSWVGLGWSLRFGSIICNHNGTKDHSDDEFVYQTEAGHLSEIVKHNDKYFLKGHPYAILEPKDVDDDGTYDGWILTLRNGVKKKYGDLELSGSRNATRWTFRWGSYVGTGASGVPSLYPYQWDLSEVEGIAGNKITYLYQQEKSPVKAGEWSSLPLKYTKASYPSKIIGPDGKRVEFTLESKGNEPYDPYVFDKEGSEGDAFMEVYESYRLAKVNTYGDRVAKKPTSVFRFRYRSLNEQALGNGYIKSILIGIEKLGGDEESMNYSVSFDYNSDVGEADGGNIDYNYGALASFTNRMGGVTNYDYERREIGIEKYKRYVNKASALQSIWGNFLDNGRPYIVAGGGLGSPDGASAGDRLWLYSWTGSTWKEHWTWETLGNNDRKSVFAGKSYFVITGGDKGEKVWLYNWNGEKWVNKTLAANTLGNNDRKRIYVGDRFFVATGGDKGEKVWVYNWNGSNWENHIYGSTLGNNDTKGIAIGNDFFIARGGDNGEKIWVYNWDGENWTNHMYGSTIGNNDRKGLAIGHSFFIATGGDEGEKVWVYNWNGSSWVNHIYGSTLGNNDEKRIWIGNKYFVATGGDKGEKVWVYNWNGTGWARKIYGSNLGNNDRKLISVGDGYFIATGGDRGEKVWVYNWNGYGWTSSMYGTTLGNNDRKSIKLGSDFFIATGGDKGEKVWVYNRSGTSWVNKIYGSTLGNNDRKGIHIGENYFVATGGDKSEKVWIYIWNGKDWANKEYGTTLGNNDTKRMYINGRHFVIRGGDNGEKIWFFKKFQDEFDKPVYSYTVKSKTVSGNASEGGRTTHYRYDSNTGSSSSSNSIPNFSTIQGAPRFNQVEVIVPGNGKIIQYFYNDTRGNYQDLTHNRYTELDGLMYRKEVYEEANADDQGGLIFTSAILHSLYHGDQWPDDQDHKRIREIRTTAAGVRAVKQFWYNDENGIPSLIRYRGTTGVDKLVKRVFAFEELPYSVHFRARNLLSQVSQTIAYNKSSEDETLEYSPNEVRAALAIKRSNRLGCEAWLPSHSYSWRVNLGGNGEPVKPFDKFDHTAETTSDEWQELQIINKYNSFGLPIETAKPLHGPTTILYDLASVQPRAIVRNSSEGECFFDSFEDRLDWTCTQESDFEYTKERRKTGEWAVRITNTGEGAITASTPWKELHAKPTDEEYIFSAWVFSTGARAKIRFLSSVTEPPTVGENYAEVRLSPDQTNEWIHLKGRLVVPAETKYFSFQIENGSSNGQEFDVIFDDVKFFSSKSLMTTFYHDSKWKKTSLTTDANGNPGNLVEFNQWGLPHRLFKVDQSKGAESEGYKANLLKSTEYKLWNHE